ncbi:MAG: hypothetical protein GY796_06210 [Chloroflexi bacterium]|nr:hypothetical protein [Chloroflexota bacterium]
MKESRLVAAQLQKRDPMAWSALLREQLTAEDVVVTAVSGKPVKFSSANGRVTRYHLALQNQTDPITFIGKQTALPEIQFYQHLATQLPHIAPPCRFIHLPEAARRGWLALEDVPNDRPPQKWDVADVERIISQLADLHATFWRQDDMLHSLGFNHFWRGETVTRDSLGSEQSVYFDEGPAAILSDHAIHHAGRLAPMLLKAANGLEVMRALGGWPGILGETHLTIAADLLDDPVPMLEPLRHLPTALLHGAPHPYHWRLTLFGDYFLVDWRKAAIGPGIWDLVTFLEQFELLYQDRNRHIMDVRPFWPMSEETMIDSYMIGMKQRLGQDYVGRAARQAIPAARCLYVLINWFTHFAEWFNDMPDMYSWQKINRRPEDELIGTTYEPIARLRPYLANVFGRFLLAYRSL